MFVKLYKIACEHVVNLYIIYTLQYEPQYNNTVNLNTILIQMYS